MLSLLEAAKNAAIPAKYVLFDSWFSAPSTRHAVKDDEIIPTKVVYIRNRNKRKEYLCLISTVINLDEKEII